MTHEIIQLMQHLHLSGMRVAYEGIISAKNMQSISNDELLNLIFRPNFRRGRTRKPDAG